MSKFLATVSKITGVIASVAVFIPVVGQAIALVAGTISAITGIAAQLTAKPPRAVGQVTSITVGANQPIPYMIGRSYSGGALIHDTGYGGVVSDVDNPYRAITLVYSGAGPIQGLVATQADFSTVSFSGTAATGYYAGFLWRDWLDGTGPAPRALAANFSGEPGWSNAHKLSGFFASKYTLKFDKKGKVWQAGVPQFGVIADGVRAYDPRLDSTFPGGSGSQRINNEATWTYTKNPALHALTYSYGRYQNGKKVFGVDLGDSGIDLVTAVAWANICDANGWEANGSIYEPSDKWNNLKLICEAGGGVPVPGARLRFDYNAPGVSIDTITIHDLADGEISLPVTQGYASRLNTVQGVYTSPDHRWEPLPTDKIVDTTALAQDGEEKAEQFPFQLVTARNQCAQLATYKMANSRELGPIVIPVKARLLTYPVGTFLTAQLAAIGLASQKVKVIGKRRTMEDGSGELTVVTETDAKHAFALAATSGAPPASVLVPPERLDELLISSSYFTRNVGRGIYAAGTTYDVGDLVSWPVADGGDGSGYIRIGTGSTTGVAPSDGTKWAVFVDSTGSGPPGADGVDGVDGEDGKLVEFVWKRAATVPATPTGNGIPSGWSDDPPSGSDPLWISKAKQELDGTLVSGESWSTPIRHDGPAGANGADGLDGADGAPGSDGTPGISPVNAIASPANTNFPAFADGTVKSGFLPFSFTLAATKAGASISGTISVISTVGCTADVISGGFRILTVTADTGEVGWRFTASDGQVVESKVSFSRQRDPASGGKVGIFFDTGTTWIGVGSYASTGPKTAMPAPASGKLKISGSAIWFSATNTTCSVTAKIQYRALGSSTWIDAGTTSSGVSIKSADLPGEPGENSPGDVSPYAELTGLTANTVYEAQMVANKTAGTTAVDWSGSLVIEQVL